MLLLLPARLSEDWENTKDELADLCTRMETETDYEAEATTLARARSLFRDEDGIVVPRVYPQYSTARVLTMERLDGVHVESSWLEIRRRKNAMTRRARFCAPGTA